MLDWYGNNLEVKNSYIKYILSSILIHVIIFCSYQLLFKNSNLLSYGSKAFDNVIDNAIAVSISTEAVTSIKNSSIKPEKLSQHMKNSKSTTLPLSHKYVQSKNDDNVDNATLKSQNMASNHQQASNKVGEIDYYHKSISYEELLGLSGVSGNQSPNYPLIAKINKWQGEVIIVVTLNEQGDVDDAYIKKSSGYQVLDSSALNSIKNWHIDNKYKQKLVIEIPVIFKLIK